VPTCSGDWGSPERWSPELGRPSHQDGKPAPLEAVKEVSVLEIVLRSAAKVAAASGVIALLIWVLWVMLDVKGLQSGFTLP